MILWNILQQYFQTFYCKILDNERDFYILADFMKIENGHNFLTFWSWEPIFVM